MPGPAFGREARDRPALGLRWDNTALTDRRPRPVSTRHTTFPHCGNGLSEYRGPRTDPGARDRKATTGADRPATRQLYIDGAWVDASGDERSTVVNPATEEAIGRVPQASVADVDRAVAAARRGVRRRAVAAHVAARAVRRAAAVHRRRSPTRRAELVDLIIAEAGSRTPDRAGAAVRHAAAVRAVVRGARRRRFPFVEPLPPQVSAARSRPGRDPQGADRRRRRDHAVQLPAVPEPREGGARARGREHASCSSRRRSRRSRRSCSARSPTRRSSRRACSTS